ncbi:unnamed protein product, partial [Laminaria digitata]
SRTGAARGRIASSVISAEVFWQPHRRNLGICAAERVASSAIFVRACVLRSSEVKFRVPPSWMGAVLGLRGGFHCWLFSCVIRVCYERVASSAIFVRACVLRSSEVKFRVPPSWMGAVLGLRGGFHC